MAFIDIDGTLVDSQNRITDKDKDILKRLDKIHPGFVIVLCTGRTVQSTMPVIEELGVHTFHVFYDGALIANPKIRSMLFYQAIDKSLIREAVEFCRQNGIHLSLYTNGAFWFDEHSITNNFSHYLDKDVCFTERPNWSDNMQQDFFHLSPTNVNYDEVIGKTEILKAELLIHSDEEAMQVKEFKEHFGDRFGYSVANSPAFPEVDFINLLHPQINKGFAFNKLLNHWGYPSTSIIAIGDGYNDISLLEKVGMPVAMRNAVPELMQIADYITDTVENSGVCKALEFLISEL